MLPIRGGRRYGAAGLSASLAHDFFFRRVPHRLAADPQALFTAEGRIAFQVGAESFVFTFASDEPVKTGGDRHAELQLRFTEPAFQGFVEGTLDVVKAVADGEVRARGEVLLLERFGRLLKGPGDALGWSST